MNVEPLLPVCYRHPDRETRLSCSSCGRPTCIDCVHPVSVGQQCDVCIAERQAQHESRGVTTAPQAGAGGAPVSFTILALCVAVFAAGMVVPWMRDPVVLAGFRMPRETALFAQFNFLIAQGEWYRLVTAAFLHAGTMHILFNMWALYLFGPPLEREVGSVPFAALYFAAALTGGAAYFAGGAPNPAVGASGAIFGLFGAWLAASFRNRHTVAGQAGLRQLLVLLGINLALPLIVPAIAWQAHLGGLAAGFSIVVVWSAVARRPAAVFLRTVVALSVAVAALGFVLSAPLA